MGARADHEGSAPPRQQSSRTTTLAIVGYPKESFMNNPGWFRLHQFSESIMIVIASTPCMHGAKTVIYLKPDALVFWGKPDLRTHTSTPV
jgi:hypothetical protein